jgi:hypothetical protein
MNNALRCAVAAALLTVAAAAQAQVFECIDARGAREFAQICPAGTVRQRQLSRGDEPPAAASDAKSTAQQDAEFRKRLQERQDAEAKAAETRGKSEEAERNCTQARTQLKALLEGQRMIRVDPDTGERSNLGDDERAADAARQQKLVEQWCK